MNDVNGLLKKLYEAPVLAAYPTPSAKATKQFYVIHRSGAPIETAPDGGFLLTSLSLATRFVSVTDALKAITRRGFTGGKEGFASRMDTNLSIVRVTEVPGKKTVKLVSTVAIDARKPVVLFNRTRLTYGAVRTASGGIGDAGLQEATIFADVNDALVAIQKAARSFGVEVSMEVRQVEVIETEPTYTEVTLS